MDEHVQVIELDDADDAPTVVYVPGTGGSGGITEADLAEALEDYATTLYVDAAVAGGTPDAIQELVDDAVAAHRQHPTPHPVYDDLPSLSLLFENELI